MLKLENSKITAYLFSFHISWRDVVHIFTFLVQAVPHLSYHLKYVIIHHTTVKNSLNQIHHGSDF